MDPRGDEIQPGRGPGPQDIGAAPPPAAPPVGGTPDDTAVGATPSRGHMFLFYASFLTLIAGGIGFAVRGSLLGAWGQQYGFTQFELGQITGAGLWGFPIAIIPLSFVVDKWGYGRVMAIAFASTSCRPSSPWRPRPCTLPSAATRKRLTGASTWAASFSLWPTAPASPSSTR